MSIVTLSWIVHTGYLLQEPQQNTTNPDHTEAILPGQVQDTTMKTGTDEVIPGHNHIFTDTAAQVIMTRIEAIPGSNTGIIATTPELAHDAHTPHTKITAINPAITHYTDPTTDHPHTEVPQSTTPDVKVDPIHAHPTNPPGDMCTGHIHIPADHKASHSTRRT